MNILLLRVSPSSFNFLAHRPIYRRNEITARYENCPNFQLQFQVSSYCVCVNVCVCVCEEMFVERSLTPLAHCCWAHYRRVLHKIKRSHYLKPQQRSAYTLHHYRR